MRKAMAEQEWVDVMQLLPVFGNHSRLAFEYVEKFAIHPMTIKVKKILRLLTDLAGLFKTGKFVINRLEYEVSQRGICEALTVVNNKNFDAPLENHNYLKKVLTSIAEKERTEARTKLDKDLRKREDDIRQTTPACAANVAAGRDDKGQRTEEPQCRTTDKTNLSVPPSEDNINPKGEEFLSADENRKRARELVGKIGVKA